MAPDLADQRLLERQRPQKKGKAEKVRGRLAVQAWFCPGEHIAGQPEAGEVISSSALGSTAVTWSLPTFLPLPLSISTHTIYALIIPNCRCGLLSLTLCLTHTHTHTHTHTCICCSFYPKLHNYYNPSPSPPSPVSHLTLTQPSWLGAEVIFSRKLSLLPVCLCCHSILGSPH